MRKLLPVFVLFLAVPLFADSNNRSQSYFTYDDGGTIVRQGDDQKEVEARVNFPVYPGDEVTTSRRGRAEIRLSDGNVIALDRGTQIKFGSIRDSYEGEANQTTVIELRYGHVMLERDSDDRDPVRLDAESASFAATERAIYSVDTERDKGAVRVYDGTIEVRTPSRTTRVRAGEEGRLDDRGLYDLVSVARGGADDFERWFLGRSATYRNGSSRYLDRSLAYADPELERYGSWVYVNDYNSWCWRPVSLSPDAPASGEVLTPIVIASAGSSMASSGSASGWSSAAIVSPIVTSSIPATTTISPAPAASTSTRSSPSVM